MGGIEDTCQHIHGHHSLRRTFTSRQDPRSPHEKGVFQHESPPQTQSLRLRAPGVVMLVHPLPLGHSAPTQLGSLLLPECQTGSTSGPLHLLLPLPRTLSQYTLISFKLLLQCYLLC